MWADLLDDTVNYAREVGWENHYGEQTWATERTPEFGMQRPPERRARTFKQNPPGRKEKSKPTCENSEMSCGGLQGLWEFPVLSSGDGPTQ